MLDRLLFLPPVRRSTFARPVLASAFVALVLSMGGQAAAAWKPTKEIKIIVAAGPGGGSDQFVRQLVKGAEKVDPSVKIVVENISGGGGAAAFTNFMGIPASGYTYITGYPEISLMLVDGTLPYAIEEVAPVMRAQNGPATLLMNAKESRFKNYDEMIAYMKAKKTELVVGVYTLRGFDDLTLRAIEAKEGVKFKRVPYVKAGERFAAVMGGHVDLLAQRIGDVVKFIDAKRMTAVIADLPERMKQYPDVPTFKEKGIPFELGFWRGIWARKGTPSEAIAFMDDLLHRAMSSPSYKEFETRGYYHLVKGYLGHDAFSKSVLREADIYRQAYQKKK